MNDELAVESDGTVLRLRGDLDVHTAATFAEAVAEVPEDERLELDLGGVGFADSSGLRTIVALHRRLDEGGGRLVIRSASDRVERLFSITGLDGLLHRD